MKIKRIVLFRPLSGLIGLIMMSTVSVAMADAGDATPLCTESTRACYVRTAKAYFEAIMRADGTAVPFAKDVRVTEQGHVVASSRADFLAEFKSTSATKGLRNMRILIDEPKGEAIVFVLGDVQMEGQAPITVRRAQRMKIVHGLIKEVEILVYIDSAPKAMWPDE